MNKKIKLRFPDGAERWGKATTEHNSSNGNQPVVVSKGDIYRPTDIEALGIQIVTTDKVTVNELNLNGYSVTVTPRTSSKVKYKSGKSIYDSYYFRIRKDDALAEHIEKYKNGEESLNGLIADLLRKHFKESEKQ